MKIAFISPWYEEHISGGAEAALRGLAHKLVERGIDVEILTTRVKEFSSDWGTNFYKNGYSEEYGQKKQAFVQCSESENTGRRGFVPKGRAAVYGKHDKQ